MSTETDRQRVRAGLTTMADRGETVRDEAVETAIARLDANDEIDAAERAAVEELADRLVGRLLTPPTVALLAGDRRHVEAARSLFADDADCPTATEGGEGVPAHSGD